MTTAPCDAILVTHPNRRGFFNCSKCKSVWHDNYHYGLTPLSELSAECLSLYEQTKLIKELSKDHEVDDDHLDPHGDTQRYDAYIRLYGKE